MTVPYYFIRSLTKQQLIIGNSLSLIRFLTSYNKLKKQQQIMLKSTSIFRVRVRRCVCTRDGVCVLETYLAVTTWCAVPDILETGVGVLTRLSFSGTVDILCFVTAFVWGDSLLTFWNEGRFSDNCNSFEINWLNFNKVVFCNYRYSYMTTSRRLGFIIKHIYLT